MASIKLDSRVVVEACVQKSLELLNQRVENHSNDTGNVPQFAPDLFIEEQMYLQEQGVTIDKIQKLAEYSPSLTIDINEDDFQLIEK